MAKARTMTNKIFPYFWLEIILKLEPSQVLTQRPFIAKGYQIYVTTGSPFSLATTMVLLTWSSFSLT
jgi:hypothetical protein